MLQCGGEHSLAGKVVRAAFVVHCQHLVFHILERVDDGGDGNYYIDGVMQVKTIFIVFVKGESHSSQNGVREVGVVGHVEVHHRRRVVVVSHGVRNVVADDTDILVAGDKRITNL